MWFPSFSPRLLLSLGCVHTLDVPVQIDRLFRLVIAVEALLPLHTDVVNVGLVPREVADVLSLEK